MRLNRETRRKGPLYRICHLQGRIHQAQDFFIVTWLQTNYVIDHIIHLQQKRWTKKTNTVIKPLWHRGLTKQRCCAVWPCSESNPSAISPTIQPGHDKAEASWSNPLLPLVITLHHLPTDTLFFPGTAEEIAPHRTSYANDVNPSPPCSTNFPPFTSFL